MLCPFGLVASAGEKEAKGLNGLRRFLVAAFLLIVVLPTAYFAAKYDGRPTALSPAQATAEYRTEASALMLAPGWQWPAAPFRTSPDEPVTYGAGSGKAAADLYWFCSWASQAVDPQLPAARRQEALDHVLSIRTQYYYTSLSADARAIFDQVLRPAADGNLYDLRRYYETNCPKAP